MLISECILGSMCAWFSQIWCCQWCVLQLMTQSVTLSPGATRSREMDASGARKSSDEAMPTQWGFACRRPGRSEAEHCGLCSGLCVTPCHQAQVGGQVRTPGPSSPVAVLHQHSQSSQPWQRRPPRGSQPAILAVWGRRFLPSVLLQRTTVQTKPPSSANILF